MDNLAEHNQTYCAYNACLRKPAQGLRWCNNHAFLKKDIAISDLTLLRKELAIRTSVQWNCKKFFDRVLSRMADIEAGVMPDESLVVMNLEFELHNYHVQEIAICTQKSGKVLLDAILETGDKPRRFFCAPDSKALQESLRIMRSKQTLSAIRHSPKKPLCTPKEIAQRLAGFMNSDTIIITWHINPADLRILREFFGG